MDVNDVLRDYQGLPEYCGIALVDVNQKGLFGDRPIHVAATRGSVDELATLLAHGARINEGGEHGYTALHDAVEQGCLAAVKWLLANGADKTARNDSGETPADLARVLGEEVIAALLAAC